MMPLRFILVGMGARSRIWRRVLDQHPDCSLVGMVEHDADRLKAALMESPDVAVGAALDEITEQVDADIALLCTPPADRHDQIAAACRAGLAILAEKPLADTLAGAEAHVAAAAAAGVPIAVGLNFRYLAVTQELKKLFAPSRLGRPEFGRFTYERWRDGYQPHLNK